MFRLQTAQQSPAALPIALKGILCKPLTWLSMLPAQAAMPVVMKEMRVRMRGARMPMLLFAATALAMTVGLMIIGLQMGNLSSSQLDPSINVASSINAGYAQIGRTLLLGLLLLELLICALVAPGLTAGAFSIEREQQTLDLLLLTPLSSSNIVFAKLISAIGFIVVIILSIVPIAAISFVFGGVSPWQFLPALLTIFLLTLCFGAIGLLCSIRFLRTSVATIVSYCLCLSWVAALPLLSCFVQLYHRNSIFDSNSILFALSLSILLLLLLATLPTVGISLICQLILGRRPARVSNMILWGVFRQEPACCCTFPVHLISSTRITSCSRIRRWRSV